MGAEIKTEIQIPDLWFDLYARVLPGAAFAGLVRTFVLAKKDIPSVTEIVIILVSGYLSALIIQPLGSRLADQIERLAEKRKKIDELYIRRVQKDLGADSRSAMILSKMHGEVTFFLQLALLSVVYFWVERLSNLTDPRLGYWLFVFAVVFLLFSFEVADRRLKRAIQQRKILDQKLFPISAGQLNVNAKETEASSPVTENAS